ncbi:MAG: twin-arginine translocation signal domain-containing protein [Anaerolineae bacterium]
MSEENFDEENKSINRRQFLKAAAVTAVAAVATGAGAAAISRSGETKITTGPSPSTNFPPQPVLPNTADEDLMFQMTAYQAENSRLQHELSALQDRLSTLEIATGENTSVTDTLRMQLNEANQNASVLAGLVALYEQLDDVDLGEALDNGLTAVSEGLAELLADAPTLNEGIELGRQALADLEENIPSLADGRDWLETQQTRLQSALDFLEQMLANAVDSVGDFLQMLADWFGEIRKWLPFGIGEKAEGVMASLTDLLTATPETITGMETRVKRPLADLLGDGMQKPGLSARLIHPMEEKVLTKASAAIAQAESLESVYREELKTPVVTAVNRQQAIRQLIAQYRQQYQI